MIYFYYPLIALLAVPLCLIMAYYLKPAGTGKILRAASKVMIASIILLSMASPYTVVERPGLEGSTDITVIADNTGSMRLFEAPDEIYGYLKNRTQVNIDPISGIESCIGDHIVSNIKPGGNILLISDGNNNCGRSLPDAINFARNLNATVYLLRQEPVRKDIAVSISSDPLAVIGTPAVFHMDVTDFGGLEGDLEVRVDDTVVYTGRVSRSMRIPVTYNFNSEGSHTVRAEIFPRDEDAISQNNVFYRSVHVIPKPRVQLVSKESSPLSQLLNRIYSVDQSPGLTLPTSYDAIVLDDMSAQVLSSADSLRLGDYVAGGGGLVAVGGLRTNYSMAPLFEHLLPVKAGGVPQTGKGAGIVVIVDISGSTGELSGADPKLGIEKGLAIQILDSIGPEDYLGVIAFNNAPHLIVPVARYQDRTGVKDTVARLRYGGTTHLSPALLAARNILKDFDGGKNVIVISDGIVADSEPALGTAGSMRDEGVTIYAIGVGGDTDFMKELASAGGGGYMRRDQVHGIGLLFGEKKYEKSEGSPLLVADSGHFITKDITLNATVYGYSNVFTKQNARTLIMTASGNPVISAWRFGLGRVVSISVDNGNNWAPGLYSAENSKVISASVNYAIGNPVEIQAHDGEPGRPLAVEVQSDVEPVLSFDGERLQFSRTGERLYSAEIVPDSTGFHDLSGYTIAVNEPSEYRELGNNEMISEIVAAAGGHVYNRSDIELLIPDIRNKKTGLVREVVDLKPLFLLAALMLYAIEVMIRRLYETLG